MARSLRVHILCLAVLGRETTLSIIIPDVGQKPHTTDVNEDPNQSLELNSCGSLPSGTDLQVPIHSFTHSNHALRCAF